MRTKYLKYTWMHFTLAVSLLSVLATVAHAESFAVDVPFAFEAAGKDFPAGTYTVDSVTAGVLIIRGATSAGTAAIMVSPLEQTTAPRSSLVFDKGPELAVLSRVNLSSGVTLKIAPPKLLTATLRGASKGPGGALSPVGVTDKTWRILTGILHFSSRTNTGVTAD